MQKLYKSVIGKQINKKAECLYNLVGKKPGFDIFESVNILGGRVIFDEENQLTVGVDAKINTFPENADLTFEILCAKGQTPTYTRFCIAHELGHLFLHMTQKSEDGTIKVVERSYYKNNNYANLYEWEAEEFAACFLMPEEEFRSYVIKVEGDIEKIAKKFKVSPQSVIMRCKRLELY